MEQNLRINPLKYPTVKCECGCMIWNQGVILKKIPGFEVGTGTDDQIIDLPVYYCAKCGKIYPEYNELYKLDKEETTEEPKKSSLIL